MTYVVTENCVRCKYGECVGQCPVSCFREAGEFLVIDPDECIDCGNCVEACPADAIYADDELPAGMLPALEWNARLAPTLPRALTTVASPVDRDEWLDVPSKWRLLPSGIAPTVASRE